MSLWDFYKADDLPGFIKEWRRLNPGQSGAVQAWIDIAIVDGAYEEGVLLAEEVDP